MTGSDHQRPKPYSCTRYASHFSMSGDSHDLACDLLGGSYCQLSIINQSYTSHDSRFTAKQRHIEAIGADQGTVWVVVQSCYMKLVGL